VLSGKVIEGEQMKKKSNAMVRGVTPPRPRPVGGKHAGSGSINWSNIGRKKKSTEVDIRGLATSLKSAREKKGMTISKLAKELQIAPATLIKFEERGHAISVAVVSAIAEQLDCVLQIAPKPPGVKSKR
jgi:ribosome-binding protein aMBF1 (putative translation factor)